MTTSHCCRVLCSHLHPSEQSHLSSLDYVCHCWTYRIKNATFYALIWSIFDFAGVKPRQDSLGFLLKQRPVVIVYLLRSCVGVQTNCHFIDYRTFQVCFRSCQTVTRRSIEPLLPLKHCFLSPPNSHSNQIPWKGFVLSFHHGDYCVSVHLKHNHLPVWMSLTFSDENVQNLTLNHHFSIILYIPF